MVQTDGDPKHRQFMCFIVSLALIINLMSEFKNPRVRPRQLLLLPMGFTSFFLSLPTPFEKIDPIPSMVKTNYEVLTC